MIKERDAQGRIKRRPLAEKFWEKVDKHGPVLRFELGPCWTWTARCFSNGYGCLVAGRGKRKNYLAHRLAWRLAVGRIPRGRQVLHRCDNPRCVRAERSPQKSHLFLGTQADNMADMRVKGRAGYCGVRGEQNGSAVLTAAQVQKIRKQFVPRVRGYKVLAAAFGVSPHAVEAIVRRKTWRWLA